MADTHQLSMFIVVIATEQCTVAVIQYLPDGGQAGEERCAQCYLIKPENHRDLPAFIYYLYYRSGTGKRLVKGLNCSLSSHSPGNTSNFRSSRLIPVSK